MTKITNKQAISYIFKNIKNDFINSKVRWQLFISFGFIAPIFIGLDVIIFDAQPQYVTIRSIVEYFMFGIGMFIGGLLNYVEVLK